MSHRDDRDGDRFYSTFSTITSDQAESSGGSINSSGDAYYHDGRPKDDAIADSAKFNVHRCGELTDYAKSCGGGGGCLDPIMPSEELLQLFNADVDGKSQPPAASPPMLPSSDACTNDSSYCQGDGSGCNVTTQPAAYPHRSFLGSSRYYSAMLFGDIQSHKASTAASSADPSSPEPELTSQPPLSPRSEFKSPLAISSSHNSSGGCYFVPRPKRRGSMLTARTSSYTATEHPTRLLQSPPPYEVSQSYYTYDNHHNHPQQLPVLPPISDYGTYSTVTQAGDDHSDDTAAIIQLPHPSQSNESSLSLYQSSSQRQRPSSIYSTATEYYLPESFPGYTVVRVRTSESRPLLPRGSRRRHRRRYSRQT
ncbi:hypothetical protein EV182_003700, partial [Spiromyces aspiralis]